MPTDISPDFSTSGSSDINEVGVKAVQGVEQTTSEVNNEPGESEIAEIPVKDVSSNLGDKQNDVTGTIEDKEQSCNEGASEWVDRGIIDVPVGDLPDLDGVNSPDDFDHHISWEDAAEATKQLPEIQKQVNEGKTGDNFSAEDQAMGKEYVDGKHRLYDLYYGSDPVRLDKDGDEYVIVSGRHRIFAAKYLGVETIPANVNEKTIKEPTDTNIIDQSSNQVEGDLSQEGLEAIQGKHNLRRKFKT
jgi:hypothetical protein